MSAATGMFYTTQSIGPRRHMTPEGFLVCEATPIARIGHQLYSDAEIPLQGNAAGEILIQRDEEHVFRPETIASFNGKSVVDEHPSEPGRDIDGDGWDVNPENWRRLSVGTVFNPRRGEGDDSDFIVADVMINDARAIRAVLDGKRELSCGYSAEYEQISPGVGRQHNIVGNHLALVEHGRCGERCSIGDQKMATKTADKKAESILARIRNAFATNDQRAIADELARSRDEMTGGGLADPDPADGASGDQHIHVHLPGAEAKTEGATTAVDDPAAGAEADVGARLDRLEAAVAKIAKAVGGEEEDETEEDDDEAKIGDEAIMGEMEMEAPPGTNDASEEDDEDDLPKKIKETKDRRGTKVRDSADLETPFQNLVARAEILVPGVRVPTFDAKSPAARTVDRMCAFRRRTLDAFLRTDDGQDAARRIGFAMNPKSTCDSVKLAFNSLAELVRGENNAAAAGSGRVRDSKTTNGSGNALRDINNANRKKWGQPAL